MARLAFVLHRAGLRLALASLLVILGSGPQIVASPHAAAAPLVADIDPVLVQQMTANPLRKLPVIVRMSPTLGHALGVNARLADQALALLRLNGVAGVTLPLVSGAAGLADSVGITALSLAPGVASIGENAQVRARADTTTPWGTAYPLAVEADRVRTSGGKGAGVTVAVLDSGIATDPDFSQPISRILARVNLADPLPASVTDPGGHGTHVAGTIAGNGTQSAGQFVGIAPGANLVDVRVLDANGNGRMSSVILGVQWAISHRVQYHIRVLNMSLGAPARASYRADPLAAAVEMAWLHGLVVVAASGNTGGAVDSPGADPYVLTVGATDDRLTGALGDDVMGWFSGYGTPALSTPKPDLVAPGRKIIAVRAAGSTLDKLLPDHLVTATNGTTYFRLTGTSMATAVVSGEVALLLERHPEYTPDQVKAVMMGTSRPFGQTSGSTPPQGSFGAGVSDAYLAVNSGPRGSANRGLRPADAAATSLYAAVYGQPLRWVNGLFGGQSWSLFTWDNLAWDNLAWDNLAWDNIAWDNIAWDNIAWDNIAWDNIAWDNIAWDNIAWDNLAWD
jgi:serine protease AprX